MNENLIKAETMRIFCELHPGLVDTENALELAKITISLICERDKLESFQARLIEDAKRLAGKSEIFDYDGQFWHCPHCNCSSFDMADAIKHRDDCPITLHNALMKEMEAK